MPKLQEQLRIFIPTRGRVNKQITIEQFELDRSETPDYVCVVPKCESKYWSKDHLVVPDSFKIADSRQFILEQPELYHVVMDDDLRPAWRREDDPSKFVSFESMSLDDRLIHLKLLFGDIHRLLLMGWVHGGVSIRQGANYCHDNYVMNSRVLRFHFYNAEVVRSLEQDYRPFTVKQDYDFTLHLLHLGIPNILVNYCVQDQPGSNTEGGCSRYRTESVLADGARQLHAKYPEVVKIVKKSPKVAWEGRERLDVQIQWKKAYKKGQEYARYLQRQNPKTLDSKARAVLRLQPLMQVLSNRQLER